MKPCEVVLHQEYYNTTKFYQILMKNKKILYVTHLTNGPSIKGRWIWPKTELRTQLNPPKISNSEPIFTYWLCAVDLKKKSPIYICTYLISFSNEAIIFQKRDHCKEKLCDDIPLHKMLHKGEPKANMKIWTNQKCFYTLLLDHKWLQRSR